MWSRARCLAIALLAAEAVAFCGRARADGATIDPSKRADPNAYRGRVTPCGDDEPLLWVPRVLFYPLYLVAEWGIRRPVYAFIDWSDRHHVWPRAMRVFHPTPDFEWRPTLNLDLGVEAWIGAQITVRNLFAPHNELTSSTAVGVNVLDFEARDAWRRGPLSLGLRQRAARHDRPFFGLGPDSPPTMVTFQQTRWEMGAFQGFDLGRHVHLEASEGYRREHDGPSGVAPSIESAFDTARLPGFGDLHLATLGVALRLDSRRAVDRASGVRLLASASHTRDVRDPDRSFFKADVDAQAAIEISRPGRVASVRFYGAESLPTGAEPVPLSDLPILGGDNHLGFFWGRFRGQSAVMAELRYRWPVAYDGDAQLVLSAGNVFARDLHDFDVGELTGSLSVGIRTRRAGVLPIEVLLGFGTTRFDQSFSVDSVRLIVGTDTVL